MLLRDMGRALRWQQTVSRLSSAAHHEYPGRFRYATYFVRIERQCCHEGARIIEVHRGSGDEVAKHDPSARSQKRDDTPFVDETVDVLVPTAAIDLYHSKSTTGTQHTHTFRQTAWFVRPMLEGCDAEDGIEARICKGEVQRGTDDEPHASGKLPAARNGAFDLFWGQIDARDVHVWTASSDGNGILPAATTHIEKMRSFG